MRPAAGRRFTHNIDLPNRDRKAMSHHIFTYGSLMFPQVWQRVVRGSYRSAPATMHDHTRYALQGETYPGMIAEAGSSVPGVVYFDVDAQDVALLDAFEGVEYRRDALLAQLDRGEAVNVETYIFQLPELLSDQPWLPEAFQMQRFLDSYCRDKLGD